MGVASWGRGLSPPCAVLRAPPGSWSWLHPVPGQEPGQEPGPGTSGPTLSPPPASAPTTAPSTATRRWRVSCCASCPATGYGPRRMNGTGAPCGAESRGLPRGLPRRRSSRSHVGTLELTQRPPLCPRSYRGMTLISPSSGSHPGVARHQEPLPGGPRWPWGPSPRYPLQDAEIVRTRDPQRLAGCDVLVDVGGEYDPGRHRYDHHQR